MANGRICNLVKTVDKNRNILTNKYDFENRITEATAKDKKTGKDDRTATYEYDQIGRLKRESKTVNGETTVFVWDDDQIVMELSDTGKVQKRYICFVLL